MNFIFEEIKDEKALQNEIIKAFIEALFDFKRLRDDK